MEVCARGNHQGADQQRKPRHRSSPRTNGSDVHRKADDLRRKWPNQRIQTRRGHLTALSLREQKVFKMDAIGKYEIHEEINRDTTTCEENNMER